MKRLLLSILMVVIGLSAFSQSPSRLISLAPAYPIAIGKSTIGDVVFSNGALNLSDIELDSLPQYEIRYIDAQTVRYSEEGYGFYVKADSLHSQNVVYSYEVNESPQGAIYFNEATGRFKYYPTPDEYKRFYVTFTATNGTESISEEVEFQPMPKTTSEAEIFDSKGNMPDAGDYITIAESPKLAPMFLNNLERTAYSVSISGKDVIFDNAIQNKVRLLSGRDDIYELNIYAERLIIRSALQFPQTNITIYAKEIIFEDKGSEISSINTTPLTEEKRTDGIGINGANAGNINLYIKDFKSDVAIRFILNGAPGQDTNRNGTPGNGGNGGTLTSTIDVSSYCDLARGRGGVKYDVGSNDSSIYGPAIGYGSNGSEGSLRKVNSSNNYLHPFYIAAVIRHANDAFINNHTEYALQTCREYRSLINEYQNTSSNDNGGHDEGSHDWGDILGRRRSDVANNETEMEVPEGLDWGGEMISSDEGIERKFELQNDLLEIEKMLFKLEQGLDYFGNPAGWVPLLSFEVYLKNYDNEIGRAIPTLYMYYWMNRIDCTLQEKVRGSQEAAKQTKQEIDNNIELLNELVGEVPILEDEAEEINRMVQDLTIRIEILQNQLMAQATKNVKKRNRLKNLFNIGKAIVSAIPIIGNVSSAVSGAISTVSSFANTVKALNSTSTTVNQSFFSTISTGINNIVTAVDQNSTTIENSYKAIEKTAKSFKEKMDNLQNVISNSVAPNDEIQAEYNKLIANSADWRNMMEEVNELNRRQTELLNHMNEVFASMTTTISELHNDALALDAFRRDAFKNNSKRDLNAMLYLERMKQRAKDRLLLYDYYLRKAYEYRLLKAYMGDEFNLNGMFDRLETLGLSLDSVVNVPAYNTLSSIYKERVSDMTTKIVNEYTYSHPGRSSKRTYKIPKEKLDDINANGSVDFNMYEMGFFSPNEENIRIVDFGVKYIKAHAEGDVGYWGELNLEMMHNGISQFRKDGHIYWFNHVSQQSKNPHFWNTRIDVSDLPEVINPETDKKSIAMSSLLSTILDNNIENVMLFSRPSVWSDITLSKQVLTDYECDIVIDSLVLELQYDYTKRTEDYRNIDIQASDGLMPYIACSEEDINGRSGGRANLYRSYRKSNRHITFTAVDKYETYYFKNWTNRRGLVVSQTPELEVSYGLGDSIYIANYERRVPVLNVQDTIFIKEFIESNEYPVYVSNIGSGDLDMDWYVSDSLSKSVRLNDITEGINDGYFTFSFNSIPNELDSLEIFAPETDMMSKKIYIAIDDDVKQAIADKIESIEADNDHLRIYPNPIHDYVRIEGEGLLSVCIYSIIGKEMYRSGIGGSHSATINVAGLPNGVYIISVKTRDGMISKKLLKTN